MDDIQIDLAHIQQLAEANGIDLSAPDFTQKEERASQKRTRSIKVQIIGTCNQNK